MAEISTKLYNASFKMYNLYIFFLQIFSHLEWLQHIFSVLKQTKAQ